MKINKLLAVFLLALLVPLNAGAKVSSKEIYRQFRNPSENRYKPFVRWWWNGDAVEAGELVRELHLLKEASIGGVEINPISMPSTADRGNHKTLKWLSPEWIDMLKLVFDEAEKIGMTCDLIVGSGWPFGSESLSREERSSVLVTKAGGRGTCRYIRLQSVRRHRSSSDYQEPSQGAEYRFHTDMS